MTRRARWIALACGAVALALVIAWLARDAIVRDRANAVLAGTGFRVEAVHLASLGPRRAVLGELVLVQDDGTRYLAEGLDLPLRVPGTAALDVTVEQVRVVPAEVTGPMPLARLLGAMLSLPETLPRTRVEVARLVIDGWPALERLEWRAVERGQALRFDGPLGTVALELAPAPDGGHRGALGLSAEGAMLLHLGLDIARAEDGWALEAGLAADLEGVAPLLADALPGALSAVTGELQGEVSLVLPDDPARPLGGALSLAPREPLGARYRDRAGRVLELGVSLPEALRVGLPGETGTLTVDAGDVRLSAVGEGIGRLEATLTGLACAERGCALRLAVTAPAFETPAGRVERAQAEVPFELRWGEAAAFATTGPWSLEAATVVAGPYVVEGLRLGGGAVTLAPAPSGGLFASGDALAVDAAAVAGPGGLSLRGASLRLSPRAQFADGHWRLAAPALRLRSSALRHGAVSADAFAADLAVEAEGAADGVTLRSTAPARLELAGLATPGLAVRRAVLTGLDGAHARFADAWEATAGQAELALEAARPGVDAGDDVAGDLALAFRDVAADSGGRLAARLSLPAGGASLRLGARALALPAVAGRIEAEGAALRARLDLGEAGGPVSGRLALSHDLDSGRGRASLEDASLHFDKRSLGAWLGDDAPAWDVVGGAADLSGEADWGAGAAPAARLEARLAGLAGFWGDIAFTGVDTGIGARWIDGAPVVEPLAVSVALVDVGLPLENIVASVRPDLARGEVAVDGLALDALGGRILARPFTYAPGEELNVIVLEPERVQLQFIVALASLDALEVTGSVSGVLPLRVGPRGLRMDGGRLVSDGDGGVIRYGAGAAGSGNAGLDMVRRALANFHYASLTSDVDYTLEGDLVLKMRLEGVNPDMDPLQPVILNLGVENNVPQLLRSLQATRAIEEVLGKLGR